MGTYKVTVSLSNVWIETTGGSEASIKRRVKQQVENGEIMFDSPSKITVGVKKLR